MHPDLFQLAAYLDGALPPAERAAVRAHTLTCAHCAARLERLRADARRIVAASSAAPVPDMRASVRRRLGRRGPAAAPGHWGTLAGALVAFVLFALLVGAQHGITARFLPDRLFIVDQQQGHLIALNVNDGAVLGEVEVSADLLAVSYSRQQHRLYVLSPVGVVAIDPDTLAPVGRWQAPPQFGAAADAQLDDHRDRLYISWPDAGAVTVLDTQTLTPVQSLQAGPAPGRLALAPDGRTLFALDTREAALWTIDIAHQHGSASLLDRSDAGQRGWLAISADGKTVYVLRTGSPPSLRAFDVPGRRAGDRVPLPAGQPPWDLLRIDADHLAIARGNGRIGGVDIVDTAGLTVTTRLEPSYDQHHLIDSPGSHLFALNWAGTVTHYDLNAQSVIWRVALPDRRPVDGAFVPGVWRWPF